MKRWVKMVIAVFVIIILYIVWIALGHVLFGWQYGGGAIPMMLFFAMAVYVWKTITKKNEENEKLDNKEVDESIDKE